MTTKRSNDYNDGFIAGYKSAQSVRGDEFRRWLAERDERVKAEYLRQIDELRARSIEWEYGWEADEEVRQTMRPRGPKIMMDDWISTPEELARFPRGRRIKRPKAGPFIDAEEGE